MRRRIPWSGFHPIAIRARRAERIPVTSLRPRVEAMHHRVLALAGGGA